METESLSFVHLNRFTAMVSTPENRAAFIKSAIDYLHQNNFDGLNLAWEYPGYYGSPYDDRERFTLLIQVSMGLIFQQQLLWISGVCRYFHCLSIWCLNADSIEFSCDYSNHSDGLCDKMNQSSDHQSDLFTGHHSASCAKYQASHPIVGEKIHLEIQKPHGGVWG